MGGFREEGGWRWKGVERSRNAETKHRIRLEQESLNNNKYEKTSQIMTRY